MKQNLRKKYLVSVKGMTLLEIVISLAIFALINVAFFGMFSTVFINMYKTSNVTESLFISRQVIEDKIADYKQKLKNDLIDDIATAPTEYSLFSGSNSRAVQVYKIEETLVNGLVIETLVAQKRPPKLIVPIIKNDILIGAKSGNSLLLYPNIAIKDQFSISLLQDIEIENEGYLIQYLYYWYISKPGFYSPSDPPIFPQDYQLLSGYTSNNIQNVTNSFGGRFIKLLVTPVGEKGALGKSVVSKNELFISPLPVYSSLLLHYDASLINTSNIDEFENNKVKKWLDISPLKQLSATPNTDFNNLPGISSYTYGINFQKNTKGVKSDFVAIQNLTTLKSQTITRKDITIYLVVNFDSVSGVNNDVAILDSNSSTGVSKFKLKISSNIDYSGQLELLTFNNIGTEYVVRNESDYRTDSWEVIKLEVYEKQLSIKSKLSNVDTIYKFLETSSNSRPSSEIILTPFTLSFSRGYAIGEVMIYDGVVSETDEQLILKYLADKYQP